MRWAVALPLLFFARNTYAVDGTVFNGTAGKPQPNATVSLIRITQAGPQFVASATSDPDGRFAIATAGDDAAAPGPKLLQANYKGVVYNKMIPPGTPDQGLRLDVYESSSKPGAAKIATHMMLLEPTNGQLNVNESFLYRNDGKIAYNDPDRGTLQFFLPTETGGKVDVSVTAPGSIGIRSRAVPARQPNVYKIDFPIKPGESRIDLTYQMPFTSPGTFRSAALFRDPDTKLLTPPGVSLSGAGLQELGKEPRTQATIYDLSGRAINVAVQGTGVLARNEAGADDNASSDDAGSGIAELLPQLYGKASPADGIRASVGGVKWILLLVGAMLALAFLYQYRRSPSEPKPRPE